MTRRRNPGTRFRPDGSNAIICKHSPSYFVGCCAHPHVCERKMGGLVGSSAVFVGADNDRTIAGNCRFPRSAQTEVRSSRQRASSGRYARASICALTPPKTRRPCGAPCARTSISLSMAANEAAWSSVEHERSREAEDLHLRQRRSCRTISCGRRAARGHQIGPRRRGPRSLSGCSGR
jgi:hypothetical protein